MCNGAESSAPSFAAHAVNGIVWQRMQLTLNTKQCTETLNCTVPKLDTLLIVEGGKYENEVPILQTDNDFSKGH